MNKHDIWMMISQQRPNRLITALQKLVTIDLSDDKNVIRLMLDPERYCKCEDDVDLVTNSLLMLYCYDDSDDISNDLII